MWPNPALNRPACGGREAARFELIQVWVYNVHKSSPAGLLTPLLAGLEADEEKTKMKLMKKLRGTQDRYRNAGWRIQWIPWWESDKPEIISQKNPLALIGIVIFVGAIFVGQRPVFGISLTANQIIVVAIAGLAITFLGSITSAIQIQSGWISISAQCIDREIVAYEREPGAMTSTWGYRLICVFSYKGKEYRVTPEPSHLSSFSSERQVQKYLNKRIDHNGSCQLWIDPNNPLHTIFHKKKWWL